MKVLWTRSARRDRRKVIDVVAKHDLGAALRLEGLFLDAADRLKNFPQSGRVGEMMGTRELIPHRSYRNVYEIRDGVAFSLALVHTARQWPPDDP